MASNWTSPVPQTATPSSGPTLWDRALERIPGGVNSPVRAFRGVGGQPFFVQRAQGAYLWDTTGKRYIDYVGTWGPAILGHTPEVVIRAIMQAAQSGLSFGAPHALEVEMAELLCAWVPGLEKVRMVNSGTEATMSCLRLARGHTRRDLVVKFEGCYHGHVDGLLVSAGSGALTHGQPDSAGIPSAYADQTIVLPFNDTEALEELFAQRGEKIAAVIVEPLPGNAGLIPARPGYLETMRRLTTEAGAVLIFDEVMTGFRVARGGMQEITGITADLVALGKVIGGGLPVGAFGGRAEIMDELSPAGPVYQAGTLSGNPLALAAGLAQLRELERQNAWMRLEELGQILESSVRAALAQAGLAYTFHRQGSMFCLFFTDQPVTDLRTARRADPAAFARWFHAAREAGIYFAPSQFEAGFLSLAHTEADLRTTAEFTANYLRSI